MMQISKIFILLILSIECLPAFEFRVPASAPHNAEAVFHVRVPKGYDASSPELCRVMVYFGGRNVSGEKEAEGHWGWAKWCDANNVFLLCPGFQDDDYWEPSAWSGQALLDALAVLRRNYRVCVTRVFYCGYSAGAQAASLFAGWRPELCRAWVSLAGGIFHRPHPLLRGMPGLVTCGDADTVRYLAGRQFVAAARQAGEEVIWRGYPNQDHGIPQEAFTLAQEFLKFYHELYREDLRPNADGRTPAKPIPVKFIGDAEEGVFYAPDSRRLRRVPAAHRVPLPSREIAEAWGDEGE